MMMTFRSFNKTLMTIFLVGSLLGASAAIAAEGGAPKRQKVIDFEGDVVEGVNKRPFDSLNQISDAKKRRNRPHLYRKRAGFRTETADELKVLRYTP
jgi:hypothetical protein